MSKLLGLAISLVALVLAQAASAVPFDLIRATDPTAEFTVGNGVITSLESGSEPADAVVLSGTVLGTNATLHLELQISLAGEVPLITFGTIFNGTDDAIPDLYILDGATPLITADVLSVSVSGLSASSPQSVTLGNIPLSEAHIVLTGGTMANSFGGVGATGSISVLLNNPTPETFGFGAVFEENWTAQMNVQVQFHTPEPGTGLLVALPLAGMAWWRRRTHTRL